MLNEKPCAGRNAQRDEITSCNLKDLWRGGIAAAFAALFAAPAFAENDDTIVVSATKSPLPLSQVGSAVTVIEADEIAERQYQFVADALAQTAGLAIARNGSLGGQAALRIRGE
ncbi:MAG: TonB-dependent receptor plug domain-containing protein, partial [Amphiplicatus sp.]